MALATQCPHCQTTFRVANDQLKLRAGLVRCGTCREVFNGIEHLVRPDHSAPVKTPPPIPAKIASDTSHAFPSYRAMPPAAELPKITLPLATPPALAPPKITPIVSVTNRWFGALERRPELPPPLPLSLPDLAQPKAPHGITAEIQKSAVKPSIAHFFQGKAHFTAAPRAPAVTIETPDQSSAPADIVKKPSNVWQRSNPNDFQGKQPVLQVEDDPLQRMTLFQVASGNTIYADNSLMSDKLDRAEDEELDRLIDELQNRQWNDKKRNQPEPTPAGNVGVTLRSGSDQIKSDNLHQEAHGTSDVIAEPRFMQQAKRKQRVGNVVQTSMWLGSVLLTFGLIGQVSYHYRDQLAANVPSFKPLLESICNKIGCQINFPAHIDDISIESNELQSIAPARNLYTLALLMRNRGSTVQAWPSIELTLNDANETTIARRVFTPKDYLTTAAETADGFRRITERPVKLTFELLELRASGYRVYLFYP